MVVVPGATVVTNPVGLTVAAPGLEELQVADLVTSILVLLPNSSAAVNCSVAPVARLGFEGSIAIETGPVLEPPHPARTMSSNRKSPVPLSFGAWFFIFYSLCSFIPARTSKAERCHQVFFRFY